MDDRNKSTQTGILGPWFLQRILLQKRGTTIYETTDPYWIIKDIEDDYRSIDELAVVLKICQAPYPIRNSVEFPRSSSFALYGRTPVSGWYALRRYTTHVTVDDFWRARWRILAVHCLRFLQDFHHGTGLVHMDIKKANIFVDVSTNTFVVGDYEHATPPDIHILARSFAPDYLWYFISMGAEMDQPLKTWRFDLTALGFVLGSLTAKAWTFENECWLKRDPGSHSQETLDDTEILQLRDREWNSIVNTHLKAYMKRIQDVTWTQLHPPSREFYMELESLFMSI